MSKKQKFNVAMLNTPARDLEKMSWKEKYELLFQMVWCQFDDVCTYLGHHTEHGDFVGRPWTSESACMAFNCAVESAHAIGILGELDQLGDYEWQFELMLKAMKKITKAEMKGGAA